VAQPKKRPFRCAAPRNVRVSRDLDSSWRLERTELAVMVAGRGPLDAEPLAHPASAAAPDVARSPLRNERRSKANEPTCVLPARRRCTRVAAHPHRGYRRATCQKRRFNAFVGRFTLGGSGRGPEMRRGTQTESLVMVRARRAASGRRAGPSPRRSPTSRVSRWVARRSSTTVLATSSASVSGVEWSIATLGFDIWITSFASGGFQTTIDCTTG